MPIKAGRLRHRITFEMSVTSRDDYGGTITVWVDIITVWASVEPLSPTAMVGAKEFIGGGAEQAQDMVRIVLRPREVDTAWRIKYKNAVYDIKAARQNNDGDTMQVYATVNRNASVSDGELDGGGAFGTGEGSISGGGA